MLFGEGMKLKDLKIGKKTVIRLGIKNCMDCITFNKCKKIEDKNLEKKKYKWKGKFPPCYF